VSRFRTRAALVAAALVAAVLLGATVLARSGDPGPPLGAVLSGPDRAALDPVHVRRGAGPGPADPAVDLADPEAVARAYLSAARSVGAEDRGRTQLRAAGYAAPGSPPAVVGVVVLDAPPPGQIRAAAVTALDLVAADDLDRRRGYRASLATATGPPGGPVVRGVGGAYVVLARQPDGRWLVISDTGSDTGSGLTSDPLAGDD
jgi:hypothetical protein